MKQMRFILCFCSIFVTAQLTAQFKPGDIGFSDAEYKVMRKAGVKTRIERLIDTIYTGSQMITSVNSYSVDGKLKTITYSEFLEGNTTDSEVWNDTIKDEFIYRPDGRVSMISLYGYDIYPIQTLFEYDVTGKLIASAMSGTEPRTYVYDYDSVGNIIKRTGSSYMQDTDDEDNPTDSLIHVQGESSHFKWNKKHQLVSETFYMMGLFYYRVDYFYDKKGRLSSYNVFYDPVEGAPPTYKNTYTYNKKGLLIKMVTEEEGLRLELHYEYTYY